MITTVVMVMLLTTEVVMMLLTIEVVMMMMEKEATHHFLDFSLGAGFLGMRNKALIGWISQSADVWSVVDIIHDDDDDDDGGVDDGDDDDDDDDDDGGGESSDYSSDDDDGDGDDDDDDDDDDCLRGFPSAISMAVIPRDQRSLCSKTLLQASLAYYNGRCINYSSSPCDRKRRRDFHCRQSLREPS